MTKTKKTITRAIVIGLALVAIAGVAHLLIFPQQTRSILVDYSGLKKGGRLYYESNTSPAALDSLQVLIRQAFARVTAFWGQKTCNPKFIYCSIGENFRIFGSLYPVPAATHLKLGSYIVISKDGVDPDIIAHEISHAEFYERIGFYNWSFKIPRWFDEGLAMQNDYRDYYSEDTLKAISNNYANLPDIKRFTASQFDAGSPQQVMLNFMTAKHEVKKWYTREKLEKLIEDLKSGKSFAQSYH